MMHTFKIVADNRPAVIERLLRVTRHRGFEIHALSVIREDNQLMVNLSVDSQRPVNLLFNQLQKLYDVLTIEQLN